MTPPRARASREGYILVAVLGVMLLLTSFMAAGSVLVRSALDTARVGDADVAISGLALGGVELTAYQLFVVKAEPAAIAGRRIRFGGGTIAPSLVDEGGKADLNASDPKLLGAVFQGVGLDSRTADALLAYVVTLRGADRNPPPASAPSGDPATMPQQGVTAQPAAPQANAKKLPRGFQSVDQLRDFPDLTRADLRALTPMLTVFNPDGKINIRSASRALLMALPGISSAEVEVIMARRDKADDKEVESLASMLKQAQPYTKTEYGPAFEIRIDATSATGRKKAVHAVVAASKSPNDPYYVLDWWD